MSGIHSIQGSSKNVIVNKYNVSSWQELNKPGIEVNSNDININIANE